METSRSWSAGNAPCTPGQVMQGSFHDLYLIPRSVRAGSDERAEIRGSREGLAHLAVDVPVDVCVCYFGGILHECSQL